MDDKGKTLAMLETQQHTTSTESMGSVESQGDMVMEATQRMCRTVFESLRSAYHKRSGRPKLIFPNRRDRTKRVSEQESKILITQLLENHGYYYSIETPTDEEYTQTGQRSRSARVDVTVYGESDDEERHVNIELKSRTPGVESFRKDFEKLLREKVAGLWFHTLKDANDGTWQTIEDNMGKAFRLLGKEISGSKHTIAFCFCVLKRPQFVGFQLNFSQDFDEQWPARFRQAVVQSESPDWGRHAVVPPAAEGRQRSVGRSYGGPQQKLMVYCQEIYPDSFVHLSIRGESYRIRAYVGPKQFNGPWKQEGVTRTSELFERFRFVHEVDVAKERKNLDAEREYWQQRTIELNRYYRIAESSNR